MTIEKFFMPLTVVAAVVGIYVAFRKEVGSQGVIIPNPASAGVTAVQTTGGVVSPINYNVPPLATNPSPLVLMSDPSNPTPGFNAPVPAYLAFNFGPGLALNKAAPLPPAKPATGGGCCDPCSGRDYAFSDGGKDSLVSTRSKQVSNSTPESWLPAATDNVDSYFKDYGEAGVWKGPLPPGIQ